MKPLLIKNKKSISLETAIKFFAMAVLVMIVANIVRDQLSGSGKEAKNLIGDVEDTDRDGIPNYYDECDCDEGPERDTHNGCPDAGPHKDGYGETRNKVCEEEIKGNKA